METFSEVLGNGFGQATHLQSTRRLCLCKARQDDQGSLPSCEQTVKTESYAGPVWKHCAATHRLRLQRMQNRFLKLALDLPRRTSTALIHDLAGVELLEDFILRQESGFLDGCRNNPNRDVVDLVDQ